ncbi:MAG: heme exporter protein CcmD [Pseudomonadota bacterium]
MGGRGTFVWLSFGIGLGLMLLLLSHSILMNRFVKLAVEKQQARAERILTARKKRKRQVQELPNESKA